MQETGAFELMVTGLMVVIGIAFVVVLVVSVTTQVRTRRALARSGVDPAELIARMGRAPSAPERPALESRLAELDELYRNGTITAEERAAARARVLGDL